MDVRGRFEVVPLGGKDAGRAASQDLSCYLQAVACPLPQKCLPFPHPVKQCHLWRHAQQIKWTSSPYLLCCANGACNTSNPSHSGDTGLQFHIIEGFSLLHWELCRLALVVNLDFIDLQYQYSDILYWAVFYDVQYLPCSADHLHVDLQYRLLDSYQYCFLCWLVFVFYGLGCSVILKLIKLLPGEIISYMT